MDAVVDRRTGEGGPPRAAIIFGNDAIVAARPHTTAQLTHACGAAGFDIIIPPCWGDELIARAYLEQLATHPEHAIVACACARVRALLPERLPDAVAELALASPPVAAARYLRLAHGGPLLVTYVGDCPSANDPSIDARFSPAGFLASLHRQGIALADLPNEVSATEAERWRRFESMPGGIPARRYLARPPIGRVVREVDAASVASAARDRRARMMLDLADAAGCSCGGNRAGIDEGEPARRNTPVVVAPPTLDLSPWPSAPTVRSTLRARRGPDAEAALPVAPVPEPTTSSAAPRSAPTSTNPIPTPSAPAATAPTSANAAPTPTAPPPPPSKPATPALPPAGRDVAASQRSPTAAATARRAPTVSASAAARPVVVVHPPDRRRRLTLAVLPAVVLGLATALGIAVYAARSAGAPGSTSDSSGGASRKAASGELTVPGTRDAAGPPGASAAPPRIETTPRVTAVPTTRDTEARAGASPADSVARQAAARRARRARAPEVVPGWLPQGQRTFTPIDTNAARRPDSAPRRPPPDTTPPA